MTPQMPTEMRAIVAQVVREVVADVTRNGMSSARAAPTEARNSTNPSSQAIQPSGPLNAATRSRTETIRIVDNADLQSFTYRLLDLFDSPKTREDVRTGRLKFELAGGVAASFAPGAMERIERGAVTERKIAAAAAAGTRLVLGREAVLTPLAREKARALGVLVEKER